MQMKEYREDEIIIMDGDHLKYAYEIKEGKVRLQWKWELWEELEIEKPMMIGLWDLVCDSPALYVAMASSKVKIAMHSRDEVMRDSAQHREKVWRSLIFFYTTIVQQKFLGIDMSPEELMNQAFEFFAFLGDKAKALDIYNLMVNHYPESAHIDSMLGVILDLTSGQSEVEMAENETTAFEELISRSISSDPLQNLVVLKNFELKFPNSPNLGEVRARCVEEYDRLNDYYQANQYLRKLLFFHSEEETGQQALFSLIGRQRSEGDPEWFENAIRLILTYPESPYAPMVKRFIEGTT